MEEEEEEGVFLVYHPSTAGSGMALRGRDMVERSECVWRRRKQDWPCMWLQTFGLCILGLTEPGVRVRSKT